LRFPDGRAARLQQQQWQNRMKILIASTPATGHINPMFAIGQMLVGAGHDVIGLSANVMRGRIEASGATFRAFPPAADLDFRDVAAVFPEIMHIAPGPEMSRFYLERAFVDPLPAQHHGMLEVLRDFTVDIIIADNFFYGALPMLLGPRSGRPPIILCGTMFLHIPRDDGAPNFAGLPPATSDAERQQYAALAAEHEAVLYAPVRQYLNQCLAAMDVGPVSVNPHEAVVTLPDAYLQLTSPGFEYANRNVPDSVRFVGALPIIPNQAPLPAWAHELDGSRKVVLVTQGTVSNHDFTKLVAPTLQALANEPDILIVVTCGGRPIDAVPGPIPGNVRLASYLPFEWLLPHVDAFVTNGGYGSVNQALSFGIPIVCAGLTEDKADVNARVAWSGVGIDLKTNEPAPQALRQAVRTVLDMPQHRVRAEAMAKEFAGIDTRGEILRIVDEVVRFGGETALKDGRAQQQRKSALA
jgi:MGT family glycosyltransferase